MRDTVLNLNPNHIIAGAHLITFVTLTTLLVLAGVPSVLFHHFWIALLGALALDGVSWLLVKRTHRGAVSALTVFVVSVVRISGAVALAFAPQLKGFNTPGYVAFLVAILVLLYDFLHMLWTMARS